MWARRSVSNEANSSRVSPDGLPADLERNGGDHVAEVTLADDLRSLARPTAGMDCFGCLVVEDDVVANMGLARGIRTCRAGSRYVIGVFVARGIGA